SVLAWYHAHASGPVFAAVVFCHGEWFSSAYHHPQDFERQYLSRVILPMMLLGGLLNANRLRRATTVASTQAFGGSARTLPYACACAGQVRSMLGCVENWPAVRFNAVCPGLTDTDMAKQVRASGDCRPDAVPQSPAAVAAIIVGLVL